jgi:hypothetical protein
MVQAGQKRPHPVQCEIAGGDKRVSGPSETCRDAAPHGPILADKTSPPHDREGSTMLKPILTDAALDYLLQSSGLSLSEAEKADIKSIHDGLAEMKARVRQKRGPMAELAHVYGFTPEDLT